MTAMIEPITPQQHFRELTLRGLKATLHHAITLNECYNLFWQSPNVLEMLNENIALTMARFSENTLLGTALNHALEQAGETLRVTVNMPDGYAFNGTAFTYTAPIIENPETIENDASDGN
jgi:hypothetical protein